MIVLTNCSSATSSKQPSYCGCGYAGPLCSECDTRSDDERYYLAWASSACELCDDDESHAPSWSLAACSLGAAVLFVVVMKKQKCATYQRLRKFYRIGKVKLSVILFTLQVTRILWRPAHI